MSTHASTVSFDDLTPALRTWLPGHRWFAGKNNPVTDVSVQSCVELTAGDGGSSGAWLQLLEVTFADGTSARYQVVLRAADPQAPHVDSGEAISGADGAVIFEAAAHPETAIALLKLIIDGTERCGVRFAAEPGVDLREMLTPELLAAVDGTAPVSPHLVRAMGVEQSNTSIVFGDQLILKLFRQVSSGVNADLELHRALTLARSEHVAPVLGTIDGGSDADPVTYAMLQSYAAHAVDGWSMAVASVRDLLGEETTTRSADLAGGDFEFEARRLGQTLAAVHADLRAVLGSDEVPTAELVEQFEQQLSIAVAEVPALSRYAGPLRAQYRKIRDIGGRTLVQRVHGDLHLGQVLRTPTTWWLLDFEGEPARPVAERRRSQSPLRDLASMARSFDYTAYQAAGDTADSVRHRLTQWSTLNRDAFYRGYAERSGVDLTPSLPLLRGHELDRLVYETRYEAASRPRWLDIPLATLGRLLHRERA